MLSRLLNLEAFTIKLNVAHNIYMKCEDALWFILFHTGYLTKYENQFIIPNFEVYQQLAKLVKPLMTMPSGILICILYLSTYFCLYSIPCIFHSLTIFDLYSIARYIFYNFVVISTRYRECYIIYIIICKSAVTN